MIQRSNGFKSHVRKNQLASYEDVFWVSSEVGIRKRTGKDAIGSFTR